MPLARRHANFGTYGILCGMTELLQHVIDRLRNIPAGDQDRVARDIAEMLEEYPTTDELAAIADGRAQFERGDYVTLEQWEHEMGSRAR
jgi:hypothetical protein